MRISSLIGRERPIFSFEFFPPKTDAAAEDLMATVADLKAMHAPDFVSVTYGAGGSTRARTLDCVTRIQSELGLTAMAHLTCLAHSERELSEIVGKLVRAGIENILALRGDRPKDGATMPDGVGFSHANELIAYLRGNHPVDIGAACYPERHPESSDGSSDLHWTQAKVRAGANFLVTQLFFDNRDYFEFVARARAAGIGTPIVPGIMPITNASQIERFAKMCGARIPDELKQRLQRCQNDPALVMATGIEHAIRQCRGLLAGGAPGLHFYTLNKSHATRSILAALER